MDFSIFEEEAILPPGLGAFDICAFVVPWRAGAGKCPEKAVGKASASPASPA